MDRPGADAAISPVVTGPATVVGERRGEAATVAARRSQRRRTAPRTVPAVAALGSAVAFIDATIVNIALPSIERSFPGTSISSISWDPERLQHCLRGVPSARGPDRGSPRTPPDAHPWSGTLHRGVVALRDRPLG